MVIFRADGNAEVGSGHVMRCLSIADAARQVGEECIFVTASDDFADIIAARGHGNHILHTDYRDMESEEFLPALSPYRLSTLFVDSYFVSVGYLSKLAERCRERGIRLVYIDDVLAMPYPCDVLVNYNIYAKANVYENLYAGRRMPELLLGTAYAPLRAEFGKLPCRAVRDRAESILISTGGADPKHMAVELVRAARGQDYLFHVVVGSMNRDREAIRSLAAGCGNIILHENVTAMSALMQTCDLAISAAGSTLYELCATQTPTVTYVLADNQMPGAEGFASRGIMRSCGDVRDMGSRELAESLICKALELAGDTAERRRMAQAMRTVVDGQGAGRIIGRVPCECRGGI
ncbi:MAG: UDP-2,4-diacetamido-2,4,6-trideoxy-beta-L-altropyranose hydrolase [bacterium]|nr:UDP-2,4-diacetamido-2,4,6-trideoxy-beta-L-altropyranose hydrolase [bacterium]MCM1374908.1 UDP-2,4-diacetamido-2,4,6-trideoxy-beta-L-altropyranose hydrolase [Muribaculum sp.]